MGARIIEAQLYQLLPFLFYQYRIGAPEAELRVVVCLPSALMIDQSQCFCSNLSVNPVVDFVYSLSVNFHFIIIMFSLKMLKYTGKYRVYTRV